MNKHKQIAIKLSDLEVAASDLAIARQEAIERPRLYRVMPLRRRQ